MVRKAEFHETCAELPLFVLIQWELDEILRIGREFEVSMANENWGGAYQSVRVLKRARKMIDQKRETLKERFGVRMRDERDNFTTDFVKWMTWWGMWYHKKNPHEVVTIAKRISPITGEMSREDEEQFRPSGSWQTL